MLEYLSKLHTELSQQTDKNEKFLLKIDATLEKYGQTTDPEVIEQLRTNRGNLVKNVKIGRDRLALLAFFLNLRLSMSTTSNTETDYTRLELLTIPSSFPGDGTSQIPGMLTSASSSTLFSSASGRSLASPCSMVSRSPPASPSESQEEEGALRTSSPPRR